MKCLNSNQIIDSIKHVFGENVKIVKYPVMFPSSSDPFYLETKFVSDARTEFYNILHESSIIIDGTNIQNQISFDEKKNYIEDQLLIPTSFEICISDSL